jgi:hypothetical protein
MTLLVDSPSIGPSTVSRVSARFNGREEIPQYLSKPEQKMGLFVRFQRSAALY